MRLGRIPWINCYPVYGAIDRGLVKMPAEMVTGTASELNDLLAAGELQVSVVSAVEYARNAAAYNLLPDLAITCDGPVHSVALFAKLLNAMLDKGRVEPNPLGCHPAVFVIRPEFPIHQHRVNRNLALLPVDLQGKARIILSIFKRYGEWQCV